MDVPDLDFQIPLCPLCHREASDFDDGDWACFPCNYWWRETGKWGGYIEVNA